MAKKNNTVDYFPHYISDGRKIFTIEQLYGNDGYACFFKLLEILARTENHYLNLNDKSSLLYLSARFGVDRNPSAPDGRGKARTGGDTARSGGDTARTMEILGSFSDLGMINADAFSRNIVFSDTFIDSLSEVYRKRTNKPMTLDCIFALLDEDENTDTSIQEQFLKIPSGAERRGRAEISADKARTGGKTTQSKVKESRVKESKVKESKDFADKKSAEVLGVEIIQPEKEYKLTHLLRLKFEDHYLAAFKEKYYWVAKDAKSLNELLKKLSFQIREVNKIDTVDDNLLSRGFELFLKNTHAYGMASEKFIIQNWNVSTLNSKFNEIFKNVKTKNNDATGQSAQDRVKNIYG